MKTVLIILAIVLCAAPWLYAHDGAFVLFADEAGTQCFKELGAFQSSYLYIYHLRGTGPEMGNIAFFRLVSSSPNAILAFPEWSPEVNPMGDIGTGIVLTSVVGDLGIGRTAVYLGKVMVYNIGDPDTFSVSVAEAPNNNIPLFPPPFKPPMRFVTVPCEPPSRTYSCEATNCYEVAGGSFTFNTIAGGCIPDTPVGPRVRGIYAVTSTEIELWFSEPLSAGTAQDISNYGIEGPTGWDPPDVVSASLIGDANGVLLTITPGLVRDCGYAFYVKDVEDLEGNPHPNGGRKGLYYGIGFGLDIEMASPFRSECRTVDIAMRVRNWGWFHSNGFCVDVSATDGGPWTSYGRIFSCDTLPARTAIDSTFSFELPPDWPNFDQLKFTLNDCDGAKDVPDEVETRVYTIHNVPRIVSIIDVPNDHGGWVTVTFRKCRSESYMIPYHVERYDIYRYGPPWEVVGSVPAQNLATYSVHVPTMFDYVPDLPVPYTTYRVLAVTVDPEQLQQYESCPDSGYSVNDYPIGTQVQRFAAAADRKAGGIRLSWTLASADAALEYYVARLEEGAAAFVDLAAVNIEGDGLSFSCLDESAISGKRYLYRVGYLENGERKLLFETEAVSAPLTPLALQQNSPNPFNPATTIRYSLPAAGFMRLAVYDVAGKEVAQIVDGAQNAGTHEAIWDGRDSGGRVVASGVYFYRLIFGKESIDRKMILLR